MSALISESWLRLRGAAHSSDRMAADIDVNWSGVARTNHLRFFSLFEIKLINLTVFSSAFFSCTYITHCHRTLVHSVLNSSKIAYWAMSERLYVMVLKLLIHNNNLIKLIKLIYTYKKQNPEL